MVEHGVEIAGQDEPVFVLAQEKDHRRFLDRLEGAAMSEEGSLIRDYIRLCGASNGLGKPFKCGYPLCPTCGTSQKNQLARKNSDLVRVMFKLYGDDHVSALTVNTEPCEPSGVVIAVKSFRRALGNSFTRHLPGSYLIGEFELEPKLQVVDGVSGKVAFRPLLSNSLKANHNEDQTCAGYDSTTGAVWIMAHFHGVIAHPGVTREEVREVLKRVFGSDDAVCITPIRDRVGWNGKPLDGVIRWLRYSYDKSSGLKGGLRQNDQPEVREAQRIVFDAYARMSGGTRRRQRIRIQALRTRRKRQILPRFLSLD